MRHSKRFQYYQPNKKDLKDKYGDCTIRALSKVFDCSWLDAFDMIIPYCREYQCSNIFDVPNKTEQEIFKKLGFSYTGISNKKGSKRPTVDEFAKTARGNKNRPYREIIIKVITHLLFTRRCPSWA